MGRNLRVFPIRVFAFFSYFKKYEKNTYFSRYFFKSYFYKYGPPLKTLKFVFFKIQLRPSTMALILKTRSAWQLSLRRRNESLTANDRVSISKSNEMIHYLLAKRRKLLMEEASPDNDEDIQSITQRIESIYLEMQSQLSIQRVELQNIHRNRTIESFSDEWILNNTRFHSGADLKRLFTKLQIPQKIVLSNKSIVSGEEAILVTLYRLSFPRRLSDLEVTFGREYSHWSRVIKFTINWISRKWWYLLSNNLEFWRDSVPGFYEAITKKIVSLGFGFKPELLGVGKKCIVPSNFHINKVYF